jgi:hypothetical protein
MLAELIAAVKSSTNEGLRRTLCNSNKDKTKAKDGETSTDNVGMLSYLPSF